MTRDEKQAFISFLKEIIAGAEGYLHTGAPIGDGRAQKKRADAAKLILEEVRRTETMEGH